MVLYNHPTHLGLPQLQNPGFVQTPQGSHTGTPCQTDDELDELPDVESVDPKHSGWKPKIRLTGLTGGAGRRDCLFYLLYPEESIK